VSALHDNTRASTSSRKIAPPFFDEGYFVLGFNFVFVEASFRAKLLLSKAVADQPKSPFTLIAMVLISLLWSGGQLVRLSLHFVRIAHRKLCRCAASRSSCAAFAPIMLFGGFLNSAPATNTMQSCGTGNSSHLGFSAKLLVNLTQYGYG
jgi:hypothetical protein